MITYFGRSPSLEFLVGLKAVCMFFFIQLLILQIDPRGLQGLLGLLQDVQQYHGGQSGQLRKQGQKYKQHYHGECVKVYLKYVAALYF